MNIDDAIKSLKQYISKEFDETKKSIRSNLYRGHLRALSNEIEDGIAAFVLDIIPNGYKAFVDTSIYIDKKLYRPDILIVDSDNKVKIVIEVKTNMGWCRDAYDPIEKVHQRHCAMISKGKIECRFSNRGTESVLCSGDVKEFFIAFTSNNCDDISHELNFDRAEKRNIKYHCLFSGWYWDLVDRDIDQFAEEIQQTINS